MLFLTWDIFKAQGTGYCNIYLPICLQIQYGPSLALHQTGLTSQTLFLPGLGWREVSAGGWREAMWNKEIQDLSLPFCSLSGVLVLRAGAPVTSPLFQLPPAWPMVAAASARRLWPMVTHLPPLSLQLMTASGNAVFWVVLPFPVCFSSSLNSLLLILHAAFLLLADLTWWFHSSG